MSKTTKAGVRQVHDKLGDTPRKADKYLAVVSLLWNYARDKKDWPLGENPTKGIDKYGKQREFEPWPHWMIDKLNVAPENVRAAALLFMSNGQRPNAAISRRHDQFDGEWMSVLDEKRREMIEV